MASRQNAFDIALKAGRLTHRELRVLRGSSGFKRQEDLAKFLGMTIDEVRYMEAGHRRRGIPAAYDLVMRMLFLEQHDNGFDLNSLVALANAQPLGVKKAHPPIGQIRLGEIVGHELRRILSL